MVAFIESGRRFLLAAMGRPPAAAAASSTRIIRSATAGGLLLLPLLLIAVWLATSQAGHAAEPGAVHLVSFTARPVGETVVLAWRTETELGTAGFQIERSQGGAFELLAAIGFVPAQGNALEGSEYEVVDETVRFGETYTYRLIEVEANSNLRVLDEVTVTVVAPSPTPTRIIIDAPGDDATPTAVATVAASATPAATLSPAPTPTTAPGATVTRNLPTSTPRATTQASASPGATTGARLASPTPVRELSRGQESDAAEATGAGLSPEADAVSDGTGAEAGAELTQPEEAPLGDAPTATTAGNAVLLAAAGPQLVSRPSAGLEPAGGILLLPTPDTKRAARQEPPEEEPAANRLYLWLAFVVSMAIFLASIIGSIILYSRDRDRSS